MPEAKRYKNANQGDPYGRLIVEAEGPKTTEGKRTVWVVCQCGGRLRVRVSSLTTNRTTSCGCRRDEVFDKNRRRGRWPGFKLRKKGMQVVA